MKTNELINTGLLKNSLRRFWPLWLAYFVVLALTFVAPVYAAMGEIQASTLNNPGFGASAAAEWARGVWDTMRVGCLATTIVAAIVVAVITNEHLFDMRAATFVGSLPVRRQSVFATSFVVGLVPMLVVPALAVVCLLPLSATAPGVFMLKKAAEWYAFMAVLAFVFFSLAQVTCQLAGTRAVAVLLYGVANVLVACLEAAVRMLAQRIMYGFCDMDFVLDWLSPAIGLILHGGVISLDDSTTSLAWGVLVGYAVAALVLVVVAAALYARRNLEAAGTSIVHTRAKLVLKYLAGISMALLFSSVYLALTSYDFLRPLPADAAEIGVLLIVLALGCFVGVLFAQMIIDRSAHVWNKVWKSGLALAGVAAMLVLCCTFDVLGFMHRVPAVREVESVELATTYFSTTVFTSEEKIAEVRDLHRDLLATKPSKADVDKPSTDRVAVEVNYRLASGRQLLRRYVVVADYFDYLSGTVPATAGSKLLDRVVALENSPEGRAARFAEVLSGDLSKLRFVFGYNAPDDDPEGNGYVEQTIAADDVEELVEKGLRSDLMKGEAGSVLANFGINEEPISTSEVYGYLFVENTETSRNVFSMDLVEGHAPHTIDWLRKHYPKG